MNELTAQDAATAEVSQASPADAPLPLPYVVENEAKRPLPGVQSVFLTGDDLTNPVFAPVAKSDVLFLSGTTLGLVGAAEALAGQTGAAVSMTYVSKEKLLKDMQFRGAISDFHPIKEHIVNADYDPLLLRSNDDDLYGDGNNFEVKTFGLHYGLTCCHDTSTCRYTNVTQQWPFNTVL